MEGQGQGQNVIVMFPSLGIGHLISMVKLGQLILTNHPHPSLSLTILLTPDHFKATATADYIQTVSSAIPSITFHHLPDLPRNSDFPTDFIDIVFEIPKLYKPTVHDTIVSISQTSTVKAVVLDFFSNAAFEVSTGLNIPTYYLFTGSAFGLSVLLHLPTIDKKFSDSFKDLDDYIHVPGSPAIHSSDMPSTLYDKTSNSYKNFLNTAINMARSTGVIANTFDGFEPGPMKALADGECVPDGPTPPTYYVGPLIKGDSVDGGRDKCLEWLDSQPSKSVVVLIFGSMGKFSKAQLQEMAIGLEKSEQRFLWVVRNPPPENGKGHNFELKEPDFEDLLPEGFFSRTKDKGLVMKNWAPQGEILRHVSVGGFVCHCGWNSVLEAMVAGVPLLAWPLYAEQAMNRVHLVEGIKVALAVKMSKDKFVTAKELAESVRELMEGERGKDVRERVSAIKRNAKLAMEDGGSSGAAAVKLIEAWKLV